MDYINHERGAIQNIERYKQLLDFSGFGMKRNITPTDFDFVIDFIPDVWIVGEFKVKGTQPPKGQLMCIERDLKAHVKQGKRVMGFICHHTTAHSDLVITKDCIVSRYWTNSPSSDGWKDDPRSPRTLLSFLRAWTSKNSINLFD